jgi:VRR-NUC domain
MLERRIEAAMVKAARDVGGMALKWTSPGMTGVPDRIVFMPNGRIIFVELKAPGKKPTPLQLKVQQQIRDLGFDVRVIDSLEGAHAISK